MDKIKARELFKKYLKEAKHRITPERFEVLDYAMESDDHFGADELFVAMKNAGSNVSRGTVYNTLDLLANCDLLAKRNFGENKSYYEPILNRKKHDHLICTKCGKIQEFSSPKIDKLIAEICKEYNFIPTGYSFNIFGKCNTVHNCACDEDEE